MTMQISKDYYSELRYMFDDRDYKRNVLSYEHKLIRSLFHCIINGYEFGFTDTCRIYDERIESNRLLHSKPTM